jgi:subtilisin family serine protease
MRQLLPALVVTAILAAPAAAPAAEGDVLVRYRAGTDAGERADARAAADVRREAGLPLASAEVVDPVAGVGVAEAVAALERRDDVLYAEPDVPRSAQVTPDDSLFRAEWGLENVGQSVGGAAGTADADIDATDAWNAVTGTSGIIVAVVDTGITAGHPDLAPNLYVNPREIARNAVDDDRNGLVDDVSGYDFAAGDANPADTNGHGTHVAGTVAARGNDGRGIAGVAWQASLLPLRALGDDGTGSVSDAIRAYDHAARAGARIVNLSLGGGSFSRAERDTIAANPGVLFVAAAGNDGADNDAVGSFPCNHDLANVLCVAASDRSDALAGFSNFGARTVDLAAPGVAIASTYLQDDYALLDGTSMATPHVSGAAALLLSRDPAMTVAGLRSALLATVDRTASLTGRTVTGGRLNVAAALGVAAGTDNDGRTSGGTADGGGTAGPAPADSGPADGGGTQEPAPSPSPEPAPAPAPTTTPPATAAGEPPLVPLQPQDRSGPMLTISSSPARSLATLVRRGLRVRVRCSEPCALRLDLLRGTARVARGSATRSTAGTSTLTLRLSATQRRRLARTRSVRLTLRTVATDRVGNRRTATRRFTLGRG